MKKLLIGILLFAGLSAYAQTDPSLTGTPILGTGVPAGNPTASPFAPGEPVSFTLTAGNAGVTDMDFPPISPFELNITIQNMGSSPTFVWESGTNYFDPPVITSLGSGRFLYTFTQNQAIPAGQSGTLRVSGFATKDALSSGQYRVRYQANASPGSYQNAGADNPANFGIIDSTLPVTLTSFAVNKESNTAILNWVTTQETNSDHFEIQRSVTGLDWEQIGKISSHGESKTENKYAFTDKNPIMGGQFNGENLYRLKMIDKDATFTFSRIQSVKFEGMGADLSIYPNPSTDKLFIHDFNSVKEVVINNLSGNTIYKSESFAAGNGTIDVRNLTQGTYIVKVTRKNGTISASKVLIGN
jgi:hypothetical protein